MSKSEPFKIISFTYNEGLSREEMSKRLCEQVPQGWELRGEPYHHHGTSFMVVAPPSSSHQTPSPYISDQMEKEATDRLLAQIDALTIQARDSALENQDLNRKISELERDLKFTQDANSELSRQLNSMTSSNDHNIRVARVLENRLQEVRAALNRPPDDSSSPATDGR